MYDNVDCKYVELVNDFVNNYWYISGTIYTFYYLLEHVTNSQFLKVIK